MSYIEAHYFNSEKTLRREVYPEHLERVAVDLRIRKKTSLYNLFGCFFRAWPVFAFLLFFSTFTKIPPFWSLVSYAAFDYFHIFRMHSPTSKRILLLATRKSTGSALHCLGIMLRFLRSYYLLGKEFVCFFLRPKSLGLHILRQYHIKITNQKLLRVRAEGEVMDGVR